MADNPPPQQSLTGAPFYRPYQQDAPNFIYNLLFCDDPELFKYPIAYMTEASYWQTTDTEAAAFRAYLQKGGFVIFDDFRDDFGRGSGGWQNFADNMNRVLPGVKFIDLDPTQPIFHSFFEIKSFDLVPQAYVQGRPIFRGLYENNDPSGRLQMIVNYNCQMVCWETIGFEQDLVIQ